MQKYQQNYFLEFWYLKKMINYAMFLFIYLCKYNFIIFERLAHMQSKIKLHF
jgi:hypothetical protein